MTEDQLRTHCDLSDKLSKKQRDVNTTLTKLDKEVKLRCVEIQHYFEQSAKHHSKKL